MCVFLYGMTTVVTHSTTFTEEGKLFADTIKHMKQKTKFSEVTSPENLMPYDPATPQGMDIKMLMKRKKKL